MKACRKSTWLALCGIPLLLALPAKAATRTAYFTATGTNRTTIGLSAQATSTCKISVSNPSTQSQTVSINIAANSLDSWNGSASSTLDANQTDYKLDGVACGSSTCTTTLAQGATTTMTVSYAAFHAKSDATSGANSQQQLRCSGNISVSDASAGQVGYIIASGVLTTFVESSIVQTDASTSGAQNTFGGVAVYTQVPITINRGKPF